MGQGRGIRGGLWGKPGGCIVPPQVRGWQEASGDKTMTSGARSSSDLYDQNCRGKPIAFEEEIKKKTSASLSL